MADCDAKAVVVVSAENSALDIYNGPPSTPWEWFRPRDITTDSRGNILTSDYYNDRIHIIDRDGHFLRFIYNCGFTGQPLSGWKKQR